MKRDFLDAAISDAIRAAWGMCAKCLRPFEQQSNGTWGKNFQCSHYFPRGSGNSTRWHPDNLCALCGSCHKKVGDDHELHYKFFSRLLGEVRFEELKVRKHKVVKYSKQDKKDMAAHYRAEAKRISDLRDKGVTGFIDVVPWE